MLISLYNSLTRCTETFIPLDPERITVYLCGPTVYNYVHIGNARGAVILDVLVKLLRRHYPKVVYARNITDVEDKINAAAQQEGVPIATITQRYTEAYRQDMERLGVAPPDLEPHATAHIRAIIDMTTTLIDRGHAYEASGHVLFDVSSYPDYGKLSGHSQDELIAGARVEIAPYKKAPGDFVLWKPSTPDQPGWDSPWGRGRPGWHIECSAMCAAELGATIDIHAGGMDLMFPHHENEIAQSTCAHAGKPFARMWLHNGMLTFDGRKMSKSVGNVVVLHTLLQHYPPEAIRMLLLRGHYRQPLDWSESALEQVKNTLDGWYRVLQDLQDVPIVHTSTAAPERLEKALCEDLNTPQALAELARLADAARARGTPETKTNLLHGGRLLGLLQQDVRTWFTQPQNQDIDTAQVDNLIQQRQIARDARDFVRADAIRDELEAMGIRIEDAVQGARWHYQKKS